MYESSTKTFDSAGETKLNCSFPFFPTCTKRSHSNLGVLELSPELCDSPTTPQSYAVTGEGGNTKAPVVWYWIRHDMEEWGETNKVARMTKEEKEMPDSGLAGMKTQCCVGWVVSWTTEYFVQEWHFSFITESYKYESTNDWSAWVKCKPLSHRSLSLSLEK